MARFGWREHQPVTAEDNKEAVTSHDVIAPIHVCHHQPKLIGTDAWILRADIPDALVEAFKSDILAAIEKLTK